MAECAISDCPEPHKGRGYCQSHLRRLRKYGDPLAGRWYKPRGSVVVCVVETCDRTDVAAHGLCDKHYRRWLHHDDPEWEVPNGSWNRKDDAGYFACHYRVRNARGPATDHLCVDCGGPAEEWSYDYGCSDERTQVVANGRGYASDCAYCPHPEHYSPRDRKCHKKYDARR